MVSWSLKFFFSRFRYVCIQENILLWFSVGLKNHAKKIHGGPLEKYSLERIPYVGSGSPWEISLKSMFIGPVVYFCLTNFFLRNLTLKILSEEIKKKTPVVCEKLFFSFNGCEELLKSILSTTLGWWSSDSSKIFIKNPLCLV